MTERDTVDGYIEALLEAHTEGLHNDAVSQSCPVCQEEQQADGAPFEESRSQ